MFRKEGTSAIYQLREINLKIHREYTYEGKVEGRKKTIDAVAYGLLIKSAIKSHATVDDRIVLSALVSVAKVL